MQGVAPALSLAYLNVFNREKPVEEVLQVFKHCDFRHTTIKLVGSLWSELLAPLNLSHYQAGHLLINNLHFHDFTIHCQFEP